MVFEQLFKTKWIEKRPQHAFIMGIVYALIGIISAKLIFGATTGAMAVAFTAILSVLSLNTLLKNEENVEIREKKLHIGQLIKDHKDIFEIYIFMFLGIFIVFALWAFFLPSIEVHNTFEPQMNVGRFGGAQEPEQPWSLFFSFIANNSLILAVCFILSFMYGAGSMTFLVWNASVWGVLFGYAASSSQGGSAIVALLCIIAGILPHMITEGTSYFAASIAGGVLSKAVMREKIGSKKFKHVLTDGFILLFLGFILVVVAAAFEAFIFFKFANLLSMLFNCVF